jgi:endonuclease YncB( thermonuclease family)
LPWVKSGPIALAFALLLACALAVSPVAAAEVLQVRGPALLQLGDGNRSYAVELACVHVPLDSQLQAMAWLRQQLPRHSRVNLRPLGQREGVLLARISRLDGGAPQDLADAMIGTGLAEPQPC